VVFICALLQIYVVCLVARAVLSWFPAPRSSFMATVSDFLVTVTEPILRPLRRVIPPLGGFDISFIVVMFLLQLVVIPIVCPGHAVL
jgi:YggT family protein